MVISNQPSPEFYRIIVKGHLSDEWSAWFDGLTVTRMENGETTISGPIVDQSALHGVLIKIRDLGLPLLSVAHIEQNTDDEAACSLHKDD